MLLQIKPIAPLSFLDITPADAQDQSNYTESYQTFVRPTLEYTSITWDPTTKQNINKPEMVQRRAARHVHNVYNSTH